MRMEVQLAGFGGQGVISMGILIASAAGKFQGKEVAQTQSYGPEARGGACKTEVVIADEEIDYIKCLNPNILVAMSQPALDKYVNGIDPEKGLLIIDNTLVEHIPDGFKQVYKIPATKIAEETIGLQVTANVVMFGAWVRICNILSIESCKKALELNMPPKFLAKNFEAFDAGYKYADNLLTGVEK